MRAENTVAELLSRSFVVWISVSDSLPSEGRQVLVWDGARVEAAVRESGHWLELATLAADDGPNYLDVISWWCELPPGPKRERSE